MLIGKTIALFLTGMLASVGATAALDTDADTLTFSTDTELTAPAELDMTAPATPADEEVQAEPGAAKDLEIAESGYTIDQGYVIYALSLYNPNDAYRCEFPTITITGKDASGEVVFEETDVQDEMLPGQTLWATGIVGDGTEVASVEFSVEVLDRDWYETTDTDSDFYTISNVVVTEDDYGAEITGDITTNREWLMYGSPTEEAMVVAVFKNAAGEIIGGTYDFEDVGDVGETESFEITDYTGLDYDSVDVYAYPWL